jgi:hypothetical protein
MSSLRESKLSLKKQSGGLRIAAWDIIAGLPAGILIFMATVLFTTLFSLKGRLPVFIPLVILALTAFGVGVLAGISRLRHGPATGLMAGLVTACLLGYLWLAARPGDDFNPLVIGLPGMLAALAISPMGGWVGARIRKAL